MIKVVIDDECIKYRRLARSLYHGYENFGCARFIESIVLYRGMLRQELLHILLHQYSNIEGSSQLMYYKDLNEPPEDWIFVK